MAIDVQSRLVAAIQEWDKHEAPAVLCEIDKPYPSGGWWRYVDETVQDVWLALPVEARLVATLAALQKEFMASIYSDYDFLD